MDVLVPRRQGPVSGPNLPHMDVPMPRRQDAVCGPIIP
jgi:hypothetical protein